MPAAGSLDFSVTATNGVTSETQTASAMAVQSYDVTPGGFPVTVTTHSAGENVWANLYNDQLHKSGLRPGDHVRMQGEYNGTTKGVFDAYEDLTPEQLENLNVHYVKTIREVLDLALPTSLGEEQHDAEEREKVLAEQTVG